MKKLIATLIAAPIALANLGDDVIKIFVTLGDDVVRVARGVVNQGDDVTRVAPDVVNQGNDVVRVARGVVNPGDDVARVAPDVVNLNQAKAEAKQVVSDEVHKAILSDANKNSINDLMKVAEAANREQYQQTGVLLKRAALMTLVHRAGAASTTTRD